MTTPKPQTTNKPRNRVKKALPSNKNSDNKNKNNVPVSTKSPQTTIVTTIAIDTTTGESEVEKEEEITFELFGGDADNNNKDLLFKSSAKGFIPLGKSCESNVSYKYSFLLQTTYRS